MSRPLELDFFGMERNNNNSSAASLTTAAPNTSSKKRQFDGRLSFRGIQNAISKINPEVLKSVISSGTAPSTPLPQFAKPTSVLPEPQNSFLTLPENRSTYGDSNGVPMTIFYNGTVSVFNVSPDKAEDIIKFATDGTVKTEDAPPPPPPPPRVNNNFLGVFSGDLPLARKKSLQRFFEKRKERLIALSPYGDPTVSRGLGATRSGQLEAKAT